MDTNTIFWIAAAVVLFIVTFLIAYFVFGHSVDAQMKEQRIIDERLNRYVRRD